MPRRPQWLILSAAIAVALLVGAGIGYYAADQQTEQLSNADQPSEPDNLIENPRFALGYEGWKVPGHSPWEPSMGPRDADYQHARVREAEQSQGGKALDLTTKRPSDALDDVVYETNVYQCIPIPHAKTFAMRAQVRYIGDPGDPRHTRLNLSWYGTPDCSDRGQFGYWLQPEAKRGWQEISRGGMVPMMNAKAAMVELSQNAPDKGEAGSRALWDAVSLKVQEPAANDGGHKEAEKRTSDQTRVTNPGFEHDLSGWHQTGWSVTHAPEVSKATRGAARVVAESDTSMGNGALRQCIDLGPGDSFVAAINFRRSKSSTTDGGARFRIIWYAEPNCQGRNSYGDHADTDEGLDWQRLRLPEVTPEPGAKSASVQIIQTVDGPGKHIAYFDDVVLRPSSDE